MLGSEHLLVTDVTFHVRYAETDMMGVVHHSAYVVYFEEGRSELSRRHGVPYAALENMGYTLALSEVRLRYLAPAKYDDQVTVRTWIEKIRSRGLTFGYEVRHADTGQLLVTGCTEHICVDRSGQARRIPVQWLDPLKQAAGLG
jgi:acyl-CoA thioester hydrolase